MGAINRLITKRNGPVFEAGGLSFRFINSNYSSYTTSAEEIIILKDPSFLVKYDAIFEHAPSRNVVEFGVFEGGSIILFALAYPEFKFVGIDIRQPNKHVLDHITRLGLEDRVKIYYGVSQTDGTRIAEIIEEEFPDGKIGIISDDASHQYNFSKRTFELTFGRLVEGGLYVLEDWAWAHWAEPYQTQIWTDQPALTNLVFEIIAMHASTHNVILRIEVRPGFICIERGGAKLEGLDFQQSIRMRGKQFALI